MNKREVGRKFRHKRIRKKVSGTVEKPRLAVHRSAKNIYVQLIDDIEGKTLFSFSSADKSFSSKKEAAEGKVGSAKELGSFFAEQIKAKGISQVIFDRGGYRYHGRIRALADSLREGGLQF